MSTAEDFFFSCFGAKFCQGIIGVVIVVKNEIVLFESKDGKVALPVSVDFDTVWLSLLQMAELFDKDKSVIFRHVKNAIAEGEIDPDVTGRLVLKPPP